MQRRGDGGGGKSIERFDDIFQSIIEIIFPGAFALLHWSQEIRRRQWKFL